MNIKNILAATAVALATVVTASAVTTTYNDGDLLLGFRATSGSTVDYVVDLGQGFNFDNSFTFSTTGIAADLAANFGAGWASSSTLKWSVFGTLSYNGDTGETNLLYTTNPSSTPFNQMFDQSSISSPMSSVAPNPAVFPSARGPLTKLHPAHL